MIKYSYEGSTFFTCLKNPWQYKAFFTLTKSQISEICTLPLLNGSLWIYLQDFVESKNPVIHILLIFSCQHKVCEVIHFQLKGMFPKPVILLEQKENKNKH